MATTIFNRRTFIQGIIATQGYIALGLPLQLSAADASLSINKISDHISVISGAGGNVVMHKHANKITLIDSGTQEQTTALLAKVAEYSTNTPITTLFNTHWHEDHTGGNTAIKAQGAQIIAHENSKLWLSADFFVEWKQWQHLPQPQAALPDLTFYGDGQMDLGDEVLKYFHYPQAHTDGDIALYFTNSNVLVAGGLISHNRYPITDIATGGWIGGLISANAALLELINNETIIIPDQGPVMTKADLQSQYEMLLDVYDKMKELARQGFSGHDMLQEDFTAQYDTIWGDPQEFILETYRGMWAHTFDMGGFI